MIHKFVSIFVLLILVLLVSACSSGGGNDLTYKVLGTASEARVEYKNAKGETKETSIILPWETSFGIGSDFDFIISVNNENDSGSITCEVWINDQRAGSASGERFAECTGTFKGSRRSSSVSFDGRYDVKPEDAVVTMDQQSATAATAIADTATQQAASSSSGLIAFIPNRPGGEDIFVIEPDGSSVTQVTQKAFPGIRQDFVWSPDGRQIAFTPVEENKVRDVYIVNADGTDLVKLTDHPSKDTSPSWSPDGTVIFHSKRDAGRFQIYRMNSDGSEKVKLTNGEIDCLFSAWSPDGRQIAYVCSDNLEPAICVMNADGSGQTGLTSPGKCTAPLAWSPDSRRIASSCQGEAEPDLYVMNADGSEQIRLDSPHGCAKPVWSPDGRQIASECLGDDARPDIYVINADGSGHTRLTDLESRDQSPTWSPDGSQIAFVSLRSGMEVFALFVMNADGSNVRRITGDDLDPRVAIWSPGDQASQ
jgi:TolB protein